LDADDVAAAGVADKIQQVIEKETGARKLKKIAARWKILTGGVFLISNYDKEAGSEQIPMMRCLTCGAVYSPKEIEENSGVCAACESEGPWEPAIDQMGIPQQMTLPKGKFYTEIENIFTTYFDYEATSIEESGYFMVARTRSKEWVTRVYGEEVAESLSYGVYEDPYSTYLETLAYASPTGGNVFRGGGRSAGEPRIKIRRLWIRPRTDKAPNGIYAVVAGQKVLEVGEWPYHDEKGKPFLNVVYIPFDEIPGRILAKTRVDDLIPKQEQRNRIEAIIELHSQRMANATWLIPEGSGLSRVTGEQGQILRYNAMAGVPPPTRMSGDSPPLSNGSSRLMERWIVCSGRWMWGEERLHSRERRMP
jgi:rubredoxin